MAMDEKKRSFWGRLKGGKSLEAIWDYRVELASGILLLVGIILSFFTLRLGGVLVGLGFGICFFEEMHQYFVMLRDLFLEHGLFKSLILVGAILYFLMAIPSFIISAAVGYAAIYLIRYFSKK